jgi:beta-aspartyl-peptidase (threonine type)
MGRIAIAVHGGAGPDDAFIRENMAAYKKGIEDAVRTGYAVLSKGGASLDAVEAAVNVLEDNSLFNAGKGAALNEYAEVEMDASIMSGADLKCGAVALVQNVKNPVTLARAVMDKTKHIYLGDAGAVAFAEQIGVQMMPDSYFITEHSYKQYEQAMKEENGSINTAIAASLRKREHGTVGAVALDRNGDLAAATSTGGLENKKAGRIGDSSIIGVGTYANNKTCAVSCTGDGEYLMQHVVAFHLSAIMEYKGLSIKETCHYLIHEKLKDLQGDMGLIAIDPQGYIGIAFNSARMHRGWLTEGEPLQVLIY